MLCRSLQRLFQLGLSGGCVLAFGISACSGERSSPAERRTGQHVEASAVGVRVVSFEARPQTVEAGREVELRWEVENASWCGLGGELGALRQGELGGGRRSLVPRDPVTVTLTCLSQEAITTASVRVAVTKGAPRILTFQSEPAAPYYGGLLQLSWEVAGADGCELEPGGDTVPTEAFRTVTAFPEQLYELRCWNGHSTVSRQLPVGVVGPRMNEVAWSGTKSDAGAEWIELFNPSPDWLDLTGWRIESADGSPVFSLEGWVGPAGYGLLERTSDDSVPSIAAWAIYSGALVNDGEQLVLYDAEGREVDRTPEVSAGWAAGDSAQRASMERLPGAGSDLRNWESGSIPYEGGLGTPGAPNRSARYPKGGTAMTDFEIFFADHASSSWPFARSRVGGRLVEAVRAATQSVEVAAFGVGGFAQFAEALTMAAARGVDVRIVQDAGFEGALTFPEGERLRAHLPAGQVVSDAGEPGVLHHKFAIIDGRSVWTGSANFSGTGLASDYNCNLSLLLHDEIAARVFSAEFDELFQGRFREEKNSARAVRLPRGVDGTRWEFYFAPGGAGTARLLEMIARARERVDVYAYRLDDVQLAAALADATRRGVAVRVLFDATIPQGAAALPRVEGMQVRFETFPGKGHQKLIVADGYRALFGSQNFSTGAEWSNDDNLVYVENEIVGGLLTEHFGEDWAEASLWPIPPEGSEAGASLHDYLDNDSDGFIDEGGALTPVGESDSWRLYVNKRGISENGAEPAYVNLASELERRIGAATQAVDAAFYDLDLTGIVQAFQDAAARGVRVRIVLDGKRRDVMDDERRRRYDNMMAAAERLLRGEDGIPGTGDDAAVHADAPLFAVTDPTVRAAWGLPPEALEFASKSVTVGTRQLSGRMLAEGEAKGGGGYYGAQEQMHHKFVVIDNEILWSGSWNPTLTSVYGDAGPPLLAGNTDLVAVIRSAELAALFRVEFETMWGGEGRYPDALASRFHGRKSVRPAETVRVDGTEVTVAFAPATDVVNVLAGVVEAEAERSVRFSIFAWAYSPLSEVVRRKYEFASGRPSEFEVEGVFSRMFWDAPWSASNLMRGVPYIDPDDGTIAGWFNYPRVYPDVEERKLHTKLLLIDAETDEGIVALGSANWGENAGTTNDESVLVIRHPRLADEALGFWKAVYLRAGGTLE